MVDLSDSRSLQIIFLNARSVSGVFRIYDISNYGIFESNFAFQIRNFSIKELV